LVQVVDDAALVTVGVVVAVTVTVLVTGEQFELSETATVYTPAALTVGDCEVDVKLLGPVQLYVYGGLPPVGLAVKVTLVGPPEQMKGLAGVVVTVNAG
jgi:hypothetical protein